MHNIRAYGIILNSENKVMLCHSKYRHIWILPGGGVEDREAPWQTVVRELKEETGLDIKVKKLVGIYSKTHKNQIIFIFECEIVSGKIRFLPEEEVDEISYFSVYNLPENMLIAQKERLKDFFSDKNKLYLKTQNTD